MLTSSILLLDVLAFGLACSLIALYRARRRRHSLPLPPGPKPWPLIGNLLDFPTQKPWVTYDKWGKTYGDIMSLNALGNTIIVVNSVGTAKELLEKRGSAYSDRPSVPFLQMMGMDFHLALAHYPHPWRVRRKLIDRSLRKDATVQYRHVLKVKTEQLLRHLLDAPEAYASHVTECVGSVLMGISYDYDVKGAEDRFLLINDEAALIATESFLPGAALVNILPSLKYLPGWLPGMGFKKRTERGLELYEEIINVPFERVKQQMRNGTARPSFTADNLAAYQGLGDQGADMEKEIKNAAATLYAGTSSYARSLISVQTASVINAFLLMLANYPAVQQKAQAELDAVVGRDRLPDWDDREHLPYAEAICKELTRWQPTIPLGVAHTATEDDIFEGYFIPKGSIILPNIWGMLQDPSVYTSPQTFSPERHLNSEGNGVDDPLLSSAFGFGRRVCPGRYIAESTLWIAVVSILATLNVGKAIDERGQEIPADVVFSDGLVSVPKPFKCSIVARDELARQHILETALKV
ncbi:cytochrome P450 [Artomyces pyxidatus]|uniref:Cytochrome P450 n=1 Tax=Artomyces pyxidatus TaxID=48021 RepID=A0ACB8T0V4_9AGAM|nr:cytochrome P450 [Artomyces pyxidatus]